MTSTFTAAQITLIILLGYLVKDLQWPEIIGVFTILIAYAVVTAVRLATK